MKKLLIATIVSLFVIGVTGSAFALPPSVNLTAGLTATVDGYASFSLITPGPTAKYRSTTAITFETVDGTKTTGWYYNAACTAWKPNGDPNDDKSDVGLGVKSNVKFDLSIKKSTDTLDTKIGYFVDKAYYWDGDSSEIAPGVVPGTGFAGTTTWGTVPITTATPIFVGTAPYADFSMGVSFALVPGTLSAGGSTTITYTMTPKL